MRIEEGGDIRGLIESDAALKSRIPGQCASILQLHGDPIPVRAMQMRRSISRPILIKLGIDGH